LQLKIVEDDTYNVCLFNFVNVSITSDVLRTN